MRWLGGSPSRQIAVATNASRILTSYRSRHHLWLHQGELQHQGENVDGDIAHARKRMVGVDQERAFYQRQAARGKITEQEFDVRMEETKDVQLYWQGELDRLKELRDDAVKVQSGLEYVTELLISLQAELPEIDIPPDELKTLPKEEQIDILRMRQKIIRALVREVVVWSDRQVKLFGVIDASEGAQFELGGHCCISFCLLHYSHRCGVWTKPRRSYAQDI